MKKCTKCQIEKRFSEFYKQERGLYGLTAECKQCRRERTIKYERENLDKKKQKDRRYREQRREDQINYLKAWRLHNPNYMKQYREEKKIKSKAALHGE